MDKKSAQTSNVKSGFWYRIGFKWYFKDVIFWNFPSLQCYIGNTDEKLRKKRKHLRNKDLRRNQFLFFVTTQKRIIVETWNFYQTLKCYQKLLDVVMFSNNLNSLWAIHRYFEVLNFFKFLYVKYRYNFSPEQ